MSSILYYSNFCEHSKKLLQTISKANISNELHFICIDKRVKDNTGKMFIVLENGQKIIMPENVNRVPALLLMTEGFQVLYGESILQHLKPKKEAAIRVATQNNLEPSAFSFSSGGFSNIVSDNYSFLDQDPDALMAKGNGGARQMHNYVDLNYSDNISTPNDEQEYKNSNRISKDLTVEQLQQQREAEFKQLLGSRQSGPQM
jgi:hypothetical protein